MTVLFENFLFTLAAFKIDTFCSTNPTSAATLHPTRNRPPPTYVSVTSPPTFYNLLWLVSAALIPIKKINLRWCLRFCPQVIDSNFSAICTSAFFASPLGTIWIFSVLGIFGPDEPIIEQQIVLQLRIILLVTL